MIKFTDNIKAINGLKSLESHDQRIELIEYLFDAKRKSGGPRRIEIFTHEEHQLYDFNEHTLDDFLESIKELLASRPHIYKDRSQSKPKHTK
jgi:hypothetical protein